MPETIHILIPTFNRSNLIKETIDSVINQSYKFWVLTIVDNNSSDNSLKIINKFSTKIKIIKRFKKVKRNFGKIS